MLNTCPILSALKHNLHFSNSYNINIFGLDIRMLFIWHIIYIYYHIFSYIFKVILVLELREVLLRVLRRRPTQRLDKGCVIDKGTKYISSIQRLRK